MATVLPLYNSLPIHHPTNTVPTTANGGPDSVNEFEQQLRLCEENAMPEVEAQEVADQLDRVSPNCCLAVDALAQLVYRF